MVDKSFALSAHVGDTTRPCKIKSKNRGGGVFGSAAAAQNKNDKQIYKKVENGKITKKHAKNDEK